MKTGITLAVIGLVGCLTALAAPVFTSGAASEEESIPFALTFGVLFIVSVIRIFRLRNA
jgi:hypothetical protein